MVMPVVVAAVAAVTSVVAGLVLVTSVVSALGAPGPAFNRPE